MARKNRILIVVDPLADDDQVSVQRGAWLAARLNLGLELLVCSTDLLLSHSRFFSKADVENMRAIAYDHYQQQLERIAHPHIERGLDVINTVIFDAPLDEGIVRHVLATNPKIVVKETHYHPKLSRALFGNVDWNLVRLCPVPLWLAKAVEWPDRATVLASVDPNHEFDEYHELDDQILDSASMLADKLNLDLHVFHSYLPLSAYLVAPVMDVALADDGVSADLEKVHHEKVKSLLEGYSVVTENVHVLKGATERLLPDLATKIDAGVIVFGSIARNALQRLFIGSTTQKVLDKLPCDVLVVKPVWFECPVDMKNPAVGR